MPDSAKNEKFKHARKYIFEYPSKFIFLDSQNIGFLYENAGKISKTCKNMKLYKKIFNKELVLAISFMLK